jgi:hypothetical protein
MKMTDKQAFKMTISEMRDSLNNISREDAEVMAAEIERRIAKRKQEGQKITNKYFEVLSLLKQV